MVTTWEAAAADCAEQVLENVGSESIVEDALHDIAADLDTLKSANTYDADLWKWVAAEAIDGYMIHKGWGYDGDLGHDDTKNLGYTDYCAKAENVLTALCMTLATKQHDYGYDNITWGGQPGIILRAHDKLSRIQNLIARGDDASNESVEDSWLDLAGYAIIGMMVNAGTFELPLSADALAREASVLAYGPLTDLTGSSATVVPSTDKWHQTDLRSHSTIVDSGLVVGWADGYPNVFVGGYNSWMQSDTDDYDSGDLDQAIQRRTDAVGRYFTPAEMDTLIDTLIDTRADALATAIEKAAA